MLQSMQENTIKENMEEKTDIKQEDYFGTKPDQEILRNVAKTVNGVVNPEPKKVEEDANTETASEEPTINPVVDLVGKTIKNFKPRGEFMQTASNQWAKSPKDS